MQCRECHAELPQGARRCPQCGRPVLHEKIWNNKRLRALLIGITIVLITHDNSIAVQAERIIRLEDGRVVYDGDAHAPEAVVQPNFMMAEPKAGEEGTQA